MTNIIDGLGAKFDHLPAEVIDDAIRTFVVIAERNGGKMIRGKYQLTAKPTQRRVRVGQASVNMKAFPSGFWAWRETGTRPHTIAPRKKRRGKRKGWKPGPMGGSLGHPVWGPVVHPGVPAEYRWTKTVEEANAAISVLVQRALAEVA